jgi:hypothetical protein
MAGPSSSIQERPVRLDMRIAESNIAGIGSLRRLSDS